MTLSVPEPENFPERHPVLDRIKEFNELEQRVYALQARAAEARINKDDRASNQVLTDVLHEIKCLEDLMKEFV